jgi:hypothetical protein
MTDGNERITWEPIEEVLIESIPPLQQTKYLSLVNDIALRLEVTPPKFALRIPVIGDRAVLKGVGEALRKVFGARGYKVVRRNGEIFIYKSVLPPRRGRPPKQVEERAP